MKPADRTAARELRRMERKAERSVERALADLMALWDARGKPRAMMPVSILGGAATLNLLAHDYVLMSVTRARELESKQ